MKIRLVHLAPAATIIGAAWLIVTGTLAGDSFPRFSQHTIAGDLKAGYQLVAVDLSGDGRKDLIAIDEAGTELAWYENQHPAWQRHVLTKDVPRPINVDARDLDGDGIPEIALAFRFGVDPAKSIGNVVLLTHGRDLRQLWTSREIDRVPTAHRVRWLDPSGTGKLLLVVAPLLSKKFPPDRNDAVPIYGYQPGQWKRETLCTAAQGLLHAIQPVFWEGGRSQQLLAASYLGVQLLQPDTALWKATLLVAGDPRPCPLCGSSEVRVGRLAQKRFLATIEPWHGNQVVVYLPQGQQWQRLVIEDQMRDGHALAVGDLDGDGRDEIIAGFRGPQAVLSIYRTQDGQHWTKTVLDSAMAAADCVIHDFTGDGRPDIVAIGARTHNLKLYVNQP